MALSMGPTWLMWSPPCSGLKVTSWQPSGLVNGPNLANEVTSLFRPTGHQLAAQLAVITLIKCLMLGTSVRNSATCYLGQPLSPLRAVVPQLHQVTGCKEHFVAMFHPPQSVTGNQHYCFGLQNKRSVLSQHGITVSESSSHCTCDT